MQIVFAKEYGFCFGVKNAIQIVEDTLAKYKSPIYVLHEIVHNNIVLNSLRDKGAIFIEDIKELPEDYKNPLILCAHGTEKKIVQELEKKNIKYIDAICPLVKKVHDTIIEKTNNGYKVILIGKKKHKEILATISQAPKSEIFCISNIGEVKNIPFNKNDNLFISSQTTLFLDDTKDIIEEIKNRFPNSESFENGNICSATTGRQNAIKEMIEKEKPELILVIGSKQSSNTNSLVNSCQQLGTNAILVESIDDISKNISALSCIGITAGASAPQEQIQQIINVLKNTIAQ